MKTAWFCLALACPCAAAPALVSRWRLDEAVAPFADSGPAGNTLAYDASTTAPVSVSGKDGGAAWLDFQSTPGVSTRLHAVGGSAGSFGFSFWLSPAAMNPGDNLLAMEMPATTGPAFTRLAWQLQVGADNDGTVPLELVVRGTNRAVSDFYGSVVSSIRLPRSASRDQWFHIAGGYDAETGGLRLFVNGSPATAAGQAGASFANTTGVTLGSVRNGTDFVAYAARACVDDLRIYDGVPSAEDVDALQQTAGRKAKLRARWKMEEAAPPYAAEGGRAGSLGHDVATAFPDSTAGVAGNAAGLRWKTSPGISTRLPVYGDEVQTDSFGFSFWLRPVRLAQWENLIGKEMLPISSGAAFTRLAWQLQTGADDGTGMAPLNLVVRGCIRAVSDLHGDVVSSVKLPLYADSGAWVHIAGGYDAATGKIVLHVNGVESSAQGTPGADCADGGAFVIGSMVNDSSFVAYSSIADMDEVQLYDGPLWATDAGYLMEHPGETLPEAGISTFSGNLTAHWKLDAAGNDHADSSGHGNALQTDFVTGPPAAVEGVDGNGLRLRWRAEEGRATRLYASGSSFQTDSFGFSFWMKPEWLTAGENLIAKETAPTDGPDFTRLAWQIQVGADQGSGKAPLELVVRGDHREDGNFFGAVSTVTTVPLHTAADEWLHVAGGYDARTGALCVYLNGRDATAAGRPGAKNSSGAWFDLGSVRNGTDFTRYGAVTSLDDVQLYDAPLSPYDVAWLRENPGKAITPDKHFKTTGFSGSPAGGQTLTFQSHSGWHYVIEASTTLASFVPVTTVRAIDDSTTVHLTPAQLDGVLGGNARAKLFLRARALVADAEDGSLGFASAEINPFANAAPYVPQFHFSLSSASVGDPTGVLRYGGQYHFFTWDHAVSTDLLRWQERGWPLGDTPPDSGYWTGSVVVDKQNTSGFGSVSQPPMVAIYTIHNNTTGKETIGVSYSTDYRHFTQFSGNPVIATADQVFRDPDVFWHEPTQRWVLLLARSEARRISFYTSPDLKSWTFASEFGGSGARNEIWETPGLAQVPVQGMGNRKKWLLHSGAGTNKVQYWIGDFDGTTFTMDEPTRAYLQDGTGLDGVLFADFETDHWNGWTTTGSAFGGQPTPRWWGQPADGHLGQRMASSYGDGDWRVDSTLTSPEFIIGKNCINFLIGGGNHPGETCVNLIVDGNVVRSTTGDDSNVMRWAGWDVAEFKGRTARIRIVDNNGGFWGRIYVDQITFSDTLTDTRREHAKWVEFGPDFFAPKFLRDYDGTETDVKWIGWIGSWEYEANRPDPQDWGKGAESVFRKLQLAVSPSGHDLVQTPAVELQSLRGPVVNVPPHKISGTTTLTDFHPATNTYELEAEFDTTSGADFGLNLCVGGAQRVTVGFNSATSNLYLDRRFSGDVSLSPSFPRVVRAPCRPVEGKLKLRVFVDQSSIEVFTTDGKLALTSQIYPDTSSTGIELFSNNGTTTLRRLRAWPLASIHGN